MDEVKSLKPEIKAELLGLAEAVSKETVERVFKILDIVITDSENKVDDVVLPYLPIMKKAILTYVDKISEE